MRVAAHGGEDHSDQKVAVAPAGGGLVTRVVRVGEYEITLKHPNLAPDKAASTRLFVTRYETNEPVAKANVALLIQAEGAPSAAATESATTGLYELMLPPLRAGTVTLSARLTVNGTTQTAVFGPVTVAAPPATAPPDATSWARTALLVLVVLVGSGLLAGLVWRLTRRGARPKVVAA